jgi:hypothetical protein
MHRGEASGGGQRPSCCGWCCCRCGCSRCRCSRCCCGCVCYGHDRMKRVEGRGRVGIASKIVVCTLLLSHTMQQLGLLTKLHLPVERIVAGLRSALLLLQLQLQLMLLLLLLLQLSLLLHEPRPVLQRLLALGLRQQQAFRLLPRAALPKQQVCRRRLQRSSGCGRGRPPTLHFLRSLRSRYRAAV